MPFFIAFQYTRFGRRPLCYNKSMVHADIFFFVSTILFVLTAGIFIVAIVYVIEILKDVRHITGVARTQSDLIAGDIAEFRENIRKEGLSLKGLFSSFFNLFKS